MGLGTKHIKTGTKLTKTVNQKKIVMNLNMSKKYFLVC